MTTPLPNPFVFVPQIDLDLLCLNAVAGALRIEPPEVQELPAFLANPSPAYMTAVEMMPIVKVIASHAAYASR